MGLHFKENEERITLGMIIAGVVIIGILVSTLIIFLLNSNHSNTDLGEVTEKHKIGDVIEDDDDDYETVSIDIGRKVNEIENELQTNSTNTTNVTKSSDTNNTSNTSVSTSGNAVTSSGETSNNAGNTSEETSAKAEEKSQKEVKFTAPIKGRIIREFAPDSLVYSETLEEWVTHNGVDIQADKTSVVTAAADGTVTAIKNDPRFGLTVIIDHEGGYRTLYANLLTAEYVVEGENVTSGQTIGTVGNSATFEIADDYHLHFELLKDGDYLSPTAYMDF